MVYNDLSGFVFRFIFINTTRDRKVFQASICLCNNANKNAQNNSVVLLINWSKIHRLLCRETRIYISQDHVSYDGCKEKTNLDHIMYSHPYFLERRLARSCNNCL